MAVFIIIDEDATAPTMAVVSSTISDDLSATAGEIFGTEVIKHCTADTERIEDIAPLGAYLFDLRKIGARIMLLFCEQTLRWYYSIAWWKPSVVSLKPVTALSRKPLAYFTGNRCDNRRGRHWDRRN